MTNTQQPTEGVQLDLTKEGYFTEIFRSHQGEARFAGFSQIFCRFNSGCSFPDGKYGFEKSRLISCRFCDEIQGRGRYREHCRVEATPNQRDFITVPNPLPFTTVANYIRSLGTHNTHSLSLTGGEPCAFPDAIRALHNELKDEIPFYLETNGIRPYEFEEIQDCITYVVPDIKIPSVTGQNFFDLHAQFLDVCHKYNKHTTIKAVYSNKITDEEIQTIIDLVKPHFADPNFDIELCMQPVTAFGPINKAQVPDIQCQFEVQNKLWDAGIPARSLHQVHKLTGHI